jgi:hypothetical protein
MQADGTEYANVKRSETVGQIVGVGLVKLDFGFQGGVGIPERVADAAQYVRQSPHLIWSRSAPARGTRSQNASIGGSMQTT